MIVAQLTDLHITPAAKQVYGVVDTKAHAARAFVRVASVNPRPDVVVISGDLVDEGTIDEYEYLQSLLAGLSVPCLFAIGNHDSRVNFLESFGPPRHPAITSAMDDFVQYVADFPAWRIMVLDTHTPGKQYGSLCERRLRWIDSQLSTQTHKPVFIFMHHPPFETGIWWMDAIRLHGAWRLEALLRRHPQVRRISCGHVHRSVQTIWAGVPASICPGVAHCVALDLEGTDFLTMVMEPPGFQLHLLSDDGSVLTHTAPMKEADQRFVSTRALQGGDEYLNLYREMFERAAMTTSEETL